MSPILSVTTAFTLSPVAPSITSDPGSGGQSGSMTSVHLLGTGGVLFAMVAIVSVAGYFYHGRSTANGTRTSNTWASFTNLLSAMRHRGMDTSKSATSASDLPRDLEIDLEQHVSMVYAKFFHPAFWNMVECHPGTPSTPTIYVEDEAHEVPVPGPIPPGLNSFLDMDEDHQENEDDRSKCVRGKPHRGRSIHGRNVRVEAIPPYDTRLGTNVNFSSAIIGTTVRPGAFLPVPGENEHEPEDDTLHEDPSSQSDSELDFDCSPYDGIVTVADPPLPPLPLGARRYGMADMTDLAQSLKGAIPEDGYGLVATFSRRTGLVDATDFGDTCVDLSCHLQGVDDWPTITDCNIGCCDRHARRVEMDASLFCQPQDRFESVNDDVASVDCVIGDHESCDGLGTSTSATNTDLTVYEDTNGTVADCDVDVHDGRDGLWFSASAADTDITVYEEMDGAVAHCDIGIHGGRDGIRTNGSATDTDVTAQEGTDAKIASCDIDVHDSCDGLRTSKGTIDTDEGFHEGLYLMEQILAELRNPDLDCSPRTLSKDSNSDSDDNRDGDSDEHAGRISVESPPSARNEGNVRESPIYPPTLPLNTPMSRGVAPGVRKGHKRSPALPWFNEEVQIEHVTSPDSPLSFQIKAHVHAHGNTRVLVYSPRISEEFDPYVHR